MAEMPFRVWGRGGSNKRCEAALSVLVNAALRDSGAPGVGDVDERVWPLNSAFSQRLGSFSARFRCFPPPTVTRNSCG